MSPDKTVRHVIIHPYPDAPEEMTQAWRQRKRKTGTVVYEYQKGATKALDSAHFMDDWDGTPTGSTVAVSGQTAGRGACIMRFLETLAKHPRVKRGMVEVVVEEEATMESGSEEGLAWVIQEVNKRHGASIKAVKKA